MLRLTVLLLLALASITPLSRAACALEDDEYKAAALAFYRAAGSGSLEERKAALDAVVALGEPAALGLLTGELGRVSTELREARDEAYQLRCAVTAKRSFIEQLELRVEHDSSLSKSLEAQQEKLDELARKLERRQAKVAKIAPWYTALGEGSTKFSAALAPAKRKKVEKEVWKDVDEAPVLSAKLAAIEILGHMGGDGTAIALQKLIVELSKQRASLERKLPKLMVDVRKLERRMQEENEKTGGRSSMGQQYSRAKREAAAMQQSITMLGHLCDAASEAGSLALGREQGKVLEKSVQKLLGAQKKAKSGARRRTLAMLGKSGLQSVVDQLRGLLLAEKDAAARVYLIDALSEAGDAGLPELLLGSLFSDESWFVRSHAYAAAARMRLKEAVPLLIDRLEAETGRLRTDALEALMSLTAEDFNDSVPLWRRWWKDHEASFEVPPLDEVAAKASQEAKDRVGTTFFGISTESKRVLFVLDLSGSMEFSMIPRNNPDDDPSKPYDRPRDKERSRLQEARIALNKAIGGTENGAVFNVVFYASDVWTWQDDLVEMDDETRSDALRMIEELSAVGGTNIYGALAMALEMAGAEGGDKWSEPEIDTIFFLTDGRPSIGLTTEPDEILAFVRDLNASAGIVIHTIGLSGAQDAYLLRNLAEQNGGQYSAR